MQETDSPLLFLLLLIVGAATGILLHWLLGSAKRKEARQVLLDRERLKESESRLQRDINDQRQRLDALRTERDMLHSEKVRLAAELESLALRMNEQRNELGLAKEEMKKDFELLSNRILEEKSKKFIEQNQLNLAQLLNPFKEKIDSFKQKVEDSQEKNLRDRAVLFEQIRSLSNTNQKLSDEAKNLTNALKGDNKAQGNWGELILEKVLESSNLRKGEEYFEQYAMSDDEGKRIQPDFVVNLPDGKHIIIDSKVSLVAFERYVSAVDEEERINHMRSHVISVKNHIRLLSEKNYQGSRDVNTPDFVLMFMPIESSFAMAVKSDADLFNFAWERKVVIVSPSTLLATLRTIASLWKQELRNRNTEEIARHAASLYDKFVGFVGDMQKIETNLNRAMGAYHDSMKKLSSGKGNLVRQVERLKDMGVRSKSNKNLDQEAIQRSIDASSVADRTDEIEHSDQ